MAKLKNEKTMINSKDGRSIYYDKETHVDSKTGDFLILIPQEVRDSLPETFSTKITSIYTKKTNKRKFFVLSKDLNSCEKLFKEACDFWKECSTKEELVIRYEVNNKYKLFKKDEETTIYRTLNCEEFGSDYFGWSKGIELKLNLFIGKKIEYTSANSKHISFEQLNDDDAKQLFGFCKELYKSTPIVTTHFRENELSSEVKEIQFTEENAKFFYTVLLSMSSLAHKIQNVLNEPSVLESFIESRQNTLFISHN